MCPRRVRDRGEGDANYIHTQLPLPPLPPNLRVNWWGQGAQIWDVNCHQGILNHRYSIFTRKGFWDMNALSATWSQAAQTILFWFVSSITRILKSQMSHRWKEELSFIPLLVSCLSDVTLRQWVRQGALWSPVWMAPREMNSACRLWVHTY